MVDNEEKFISGIHNYCDRWCERCTFTARCRVAEMEAETTDEERDINNEAFWRRLTANFAEAKQMLQEMAEELDIDLNAVSDQEFTEHRNRQNKIIRNENLTKLAEKYWKDARQILEEKDSWLIFSPLDEEAQNEMLSIIYWYQFFISAKVQRGFSGILDFDGNLEEEELTDTQSDANGSVKIALIAVERSIMAWSALMTNENHAKIKPFIALLEKIRRECEEKFPNARDFIRPGFDELETIM